jgi:hypothetical protein
VVRKASVPFMLMAVAPVRTTPILPAQSRNFPAKCGAFIAISAIILYD